MKLEISEIRWNEIRSMKFLQNYKIIAKKKLEQAKHNSQIA